MRRLTTLAAVLLLGGCSLLHWRPGGDIDALQARHQYVAALAALDKYHRSDRDYADHRQALLDAAASYQAQLTKTLQTAVETHHFAAATRALGQARTELPPNPALQNAIARFEQARQTYVEDKLQALAQMRGAHLLQEQALYRDLTGVTENDELQAAIARYQADADYFADQLAGAGNRAMQRGDYEAARDYLTTANRLHPSSDRAAALDAAVQAIATRQQQEIRNRANEQEQRYGSLETALQKALAERDFPRARNLLAALHKLGLHKAEVERYRHRLNGAIAAFAAARIDAGNQLYAEGHIEAALKNWRQAYAVAPSADLKDRIEKAEKFMQRYKDLKQQPAAPTVPPTPPAPAAPLQ